MVSYFEKFTFLHRQKKALLFFGMILIVGFSFVAFAFASQVLTARVTSTSYGAPQRMPKNEFPRQIVTTGTNDSMQDTSATDTPTGESGRSGSCAAEIVRYTGENGIARCFTGVQYICRGGGYDGRAFSAGPGRCRTKDAWAVEANRLCGCGDVDEDILFGNCRYKAIELVSAGYDSTRVSCTRAGMSGSCHYEAKVTCNDDQTHHVNSYSCLERNRQSGNDWDFYANLICCRSMEVSDPGEKPQACREFAFEDYSICSAYCKQRGFECVAGGTRDLRCTDTRCG